MLDGKLRIDLRDGHVDLEKGELYVVPQGVWHKPFSEHDVQLVPIEPPGVLNTGDEGGELTADNDAWI